MADVGVGGKTVKYALPLLTTKEVSWWLNVPLSGLDQWRKDNSGPPYLRNGQAWNSRVRYDIREVMAFLESRTVEIAPRGEIGKNLRRLLKSSDVETWLNLRPGYLMTWRRKKMGPCYIKFANGDSGGVRYRPEDVAAWLAAQNGRHDRKTCFCAACQAKRRKL